MGEVAASYVSVYPKITDNFGAQLQTQMRKSSAGAFGPIEQESKKAGEKSGKTFGNSMGVGIKAVLAGGAAVAVVRFVGDSVKAFSELQDATGAASVVFGSGMDLITAKAEKAAEVAGVSKVAWLNGAITMGTFGKSAGLSGEALANFSNGLAQTAADMASFRGTTPEQAIEAVGAALRGETEPIRAYGVLLDDASLRQEALRMGLIDTTKNALSPQNRVLAAQALILKQTKDAQGDYARTADSSANVQKTLAAESANLSAEIGEKLAPAIVSAQKAGIGLIQWATDNQAALVPLAGSFATVAAAIGGVIVVGKGIEALKSARDTINGIGDAFQAMSLKAKVATVSAGAIGIALVAAGVVYGAFAQRAANATQAVEDYTQAIQADNGALGANVDLMVAKRLEADGALKAAQTLGISTADVTRAVIQGGDAMKKVQDIMASHSDQMGEQTAESVKLGEAARVLNGSLGAQNTGLTDAVAGYKRVADAANDGTTATKGNTTATTDNSTALKTNADKLNAVYTARLKLRGDKRSLEAAIDSATESFKKNGKTLDENTPKGRANAQALDDIASAGLAVGGDMGRARTAFIKVATSMTGSATEARKLADKLGLIKSKKVTVDVGINVAWHGDLNKTFKIGAKGFAKVGMADGGAISGGIPGRDSVHVLAMPGEHMFDTQDVKAMGGQQAVYRFRAALKSGSRAARTGGLPGVSSGLTKADMIEALSSVTLRLGGGSALSDYITGRFELAKEMA